MIVLALDSATPVLSVCLRFDREGRTESHTVVRDAGMSHSRSLMPIVAAVLSAMEIDSSRIDLVACTRGPGSFTGLRIGMSTAKGLAAAVAEKHSLPAPPLVGVPTLDAMAAPFADQPGLVVPLVDARKGRYYAGFYRGAERLLGPVDECATGIAAMMAKLVAEASLPFCLVTGPDAAAFAAESGTGAVVDPAARRGWAPFVAALAVERLAAHGVDPIDAGPIYLRASDARTPGEQR